MRAVQRGWCSLPSALRQGAGFPDFPKPSPSLGAHHFPWQYVCFLGDVTFATSPPSPVSSTSPRGLVGHRPGLWASLSLHSLSSL